MQLKPYVHKAQYYETDQMGVVHHSNHIRWFEEARVDWMAQMGLTYRKLEEGGIIIPVLGVECEYKTMVRFEDVVHIHTQVETVKNARLGIGYRMTDETGEILYATGRTSHCFMDREGRVVALKRVRPDYYAMFFDSMA